jgi:hypothetical protein
MCYFLLFEPRYSYNPKKLLITFCTSAIDTLLLLSVFTHASAGFNPKNIFMDDCTSAMVTLPLLSQSPFIARVGILLAAQPLISSVVCPEGLAHIEVLSAVSV